MKKVAFFLLIGLVILPLAGQAYAALTPPGGTQPAPAPQVPTQQFGIGVCGASADNPNTPYNEKDACNFCHIFLLATSILNFFLGTIIPPLAALFVVVGGFMMLTAGGNPQSVSRGRTVLTAVVIGLIIVYASWIFVNTIFQALGVSQWAGLGNWWQISCVAK